jgi:HSP20 family molecular chaperone IbpA
MLNHKGTKSFFCLSRQGTFFQAECVSLLIGLATLAIGLLMGLYIAKHVSWHAEYVESSANSPASPAAAPNPALPNANESDPFTEMRRMQEQMDQMMNQSIQQFRNDPKFNGFVDPPGYSLSLDLREFKDRFEVHAALPDAKASDINVKLEDDHTLSVDVSNKVAANSQQGSASTTTQEWGQYKQTVQLPAAVQTSKMKVDRKDHELVIVLPKA